MPDKTYAKFILNNETYLDLTSDTVDSSSLLSGYTAHDRSGAPITGSFDPSVYVLKAGDTMTGTLNLPTLNLTGTAEEGYVNETKVILNKISLSKIWNDDIFSLPAPPPYPIKLVSTIDNSETMHTNYYGNIARTDLAKRSGIHFNSKVIGEADEEHDPPTWEMFCESDIILGNEYFNNVFEDNNTGTTLGPFVRPHFSLEYNSGTNSSLNFEAEMMDDDDYKYTQKSSYFNKLSYPIFGDAGYTDVTLETYDNGSLCISTGSKTEIYNSENPAHENKYYTNYGDIRLTAISPKRFSIVNIDSNGYFYKAIEMGDFGQVGSPDGYIRINNIDIRQGLPFLYKIWSNDFNYNIAANTNLANNSLVKLRTYTCNSTNIVSTLSNKPSDLTKPFMMYAMSPVLTTHNTPTSGSTALYMMRKIIDSDGNEWNQSVSGTYASKTFGSWKKMATTDDLSSYLPLTGGIMGGTVEDPNDNTHANVYANNIFPDHIAMSNTEYYSGSISGYTTNAITSEGIGISKLYTDTSLGYTLNSSLTNQELSFTGGVYGGSQTTYASYKSSGISYTTYDYTFPSASGTLALTSDLNSYVLKSGDSMTGALSFYDGSTLKSKISNTELQVNGHDLLRMTPHFAQTFATVIANNSNLNSETYLKVGQYYVANNAAAGTLSNCPATDAFTMTVEATISASYDDENTQSVGRVRKITTWRGVQYIQACVRGASAWDYGAWQLYIVGSKVGTLSNASGTSFAESYCQQYGRTVNIRAWITGLSTTTQTHENVITVGAVDMPTTPIRFVVTCWLGNGIAAYAGYGTMNTNGKITLLKAVANSDKASFEFTYNV